MPSTANMTVQHYYKLDEKERSKPPTKLDLRETRDLLYDFGICVAIPDFRSRSQLYEWRREVIRNKLG